MLVRTGLSYAPRAATLQSARLALRKTPVELQMQFGDDEPVRALDLFQLVKVDGRWWIVSIISEIAKDAAISDRA